MEVQTCRRPISQGFKLLFFRLMTRNVIHVFPYFLLYSHVIPHAIDGTKRLRANRAGARSRNCQQPAQRVFLEEIPPFHSYTARVPVVRKISDGPAENPEKCFKSVFSTFTVSSASAAILHERSCFGGFFFTLSFFFLHTL